MKNKVEWIKKSSGFLLFDTELKRSIRSFEASSLSYLTAEPRPAHIVGFGLPVSRLAYKSNDTALPQQNFTVKVDYSNKQPFTSKQTFEVKNKCLVLKGIK